MSVPSRLDSAAMTAAEFRVARDYLGVTSEWLATHWQISERIIRKWEQGATRVPDKRADQLRKLVKDQDDFVDQVVRAVRETDDPNVSEWVLTFSSDETYRVEHPDEPWSAGWHRAAIGRVARQEPSIRLRYAREADEDV